MRRMGLYGGELGVLLGIGEKTLIMQDGISRANYVISRAN